MVTYREITQEDIGILADFRLEMFRDMGLIQDKDQAEKLLQESASYFLSIFDTQHLLAIIAEAQGGAVAAGILSISQMAPKPGNLSGLEGYIYNLYTLPAWRNKGIGTEIFSRLLSIARHKDIKYHWLFATEDGQKIYARQGFVPITTAMMKVVGD